MKRNFALLIIFSIIFAASICFGQNNSKTYRETRSLLKTSNLYFSDRALGKLFQIGDERIDDLIIALDDKDEEVALNAQRIIRYLGNPKATKALYDWFGKQQHLKIAFGAIPLPINQWEFDFAEFQINKSGNVLDSGFATGNIYPLLLDDSKQAKELLEKIIKELGKSEAGKYWVEKFNQIIKNNPKKVFKVDGNLEKSILQNAYFLHTGESQHTSVKLLAYNLKKDRALVYLGNFGAKWHIVIEKAGEGWRFYSITQTSVS